MPKLKSIFGTHRVGSDDLAISSVVDIVSQLFWYIWLKYFSTYSSTTTETASSIYTSSSSSNNNKDTICEQGYFYYVIMPNLFLANIGVSVLIYIFSLRGTMINDTPRRFISYFVIFKFMLDICSMLNLIAIIGELIYYGVCSFYLIFEIAILGFVVQLSFFTSWHWLIPSALKKTKVHQLLPDNFNERNFTNHTTINRSNFHQSSSYPISQEDLDISHGDIFCGAIILSVIQEKKRSSTNRSCSCFETNPTNKPIVIQTWMNVRNARHYLRYASGIYGWQFFVMSEGKECYGLMSYFRKHSRKSLVRTHPPNKVINDGWLLNYRTFLYSTGLSDKDVIHANYGNAMFQICMVVSVDHAYKSIVLTLRGSNSLTDFLIDAVTIDSGPLDILRVPGSKAHYGMLETARNMMKLLLEKGDDELNLIERARKKVEIDVGEDESKKYQLVIVGHSLGAGVASLLSILLRDIPDYDDVICFAFSPPACLMTSDLGEYCSSFVMSIVVDSDVVSRCNVIQV
ncbi:hypothetical protein HELRODRAFT_193279, partial [Helobdella robusta]|uniref:sn-1-specific diacylglycerol lipase n=1 Tax=Helobdella robusta TaxID=6412 RepID=T1FUT7_HELRO